MRLHADDQIEQLLSLDDLRRGLSPDGSGDHGFEVGDVDSVARDLGAVNVNEETGLSELAHHGEIGESGDASQSVLDLDRLVLDDIQIIPINLDGE